MKHTIFILVLVVLAVAAVGATSFKANPLKNKQEIINGFNRITSFLKLHQKAVTKNGLGDMSVLCALCGIAVNEIEGFVSENISLTTIVDTITNDVCSLFPSTGGLKTDCDNLVYQIPSIIKLIEAKNTPSTVCIEINYCTAPFYHQDDPSSVPTYQINLDLPPIQRFSQVCSLPIYQSSAQFLYGVMVSLLDGYVNYVTDIGELLNDYYFPAARGLELKGCAQTIGIPYGWLALFNIGYEISDACTSILAQTPSGTIYHARNMDFWAGMGFTDTLKNLTFTAQYMKSNKTLFYATTFAGYVGVLSGMKPNGFSVAINTRFYPQGPGDMFYEIIAAIMENNASLVSFLSREVMEVENDYKGAVNALSGSELIADVYYTVAGIGSGEGSVLSRNRKNATDVWSLDAQKGRWYEVQTNYDHWTTAPWFDDRVVPANRGMDAMGQKALSLEGMLKVLTIKPVLNIQTTFTMLACPSEGTYKSYTRWCPYPCVE